MKHIDGMGFAARGLDRRSLDKGGVAEAGDDRRLRSQGRVRHGDLQPGERVVVDEGKLLSSDQFVTYDEDPS